MERTTSRHSRRRDPPACSSRYLLTALGIDSVVIEARSREYIEGRIRAGVLEHGVVQALDAAGVGARMHQIGLPHAGTQFLFNGTIHRIDFQELTGKSVMVYPSTKSSATSWPRASKRAAKWYSRPPTCTCGAIHPGPRQSITKRAGPSKFCHAISSPAVTASTAYAGPASAPPPSTASTRSAGSASSPRPRSARRSSLRQPRPRLRPALHALAGGAAPLSPMRAGRGRRGLVRRPHLVRACGPGCKTTASSSDRPHLPERRHPHALLRGRAHAVRPPFPRRRRRPHRAPHRRQGHELPRSATSSFSPARSSAGSNAATTPASKPIPRPRCAASGRSSASPGG